MLLSTSARSVRTATRCVAACCVVTTLLTACASQPSNSQPSNSQPSSSDITSNDSTARLGAVHTAATLSPGDYALVVFGMSCPKCISNVDLQLGRIAGIAHPKVDMKHGIVTIEVPGPAEPSREAIFRAILDAGFTLREIRALPAKEHQQ